MTDLLHVFLFIIVFIVIHIIVLHLTNKSLSVNIKQRIVMDDAPVIKIRSLSRHRQMELVKQELGERMLPFVLPCRGSEPSAVYRYPCAGHDEQLDH